jgi:hypothetical protein
VRRAVRSIVDTARTYVSGGSVVDTEAAAIVQKAAD